jgi:hypothetical protein
MAAKKLSSAELNHPCLPRRFYTAVVHAPGFEGKYSLDVVYFETRQYPNSTNAKGKFTGTRIQHRTHTHIHTHTHTPCVRYGC